MQQYGTGLPVYNYGTVLSLGWSWVLYACIIIIIIIDTMVYCYYFNHICVIIIFNILFENFHPCLRGNIRGSILVCAHSGDIPCRLDWRCCCQPWLIQSAECLCSVQWPYGPQKGCWDLACFQVLQ